MFLWLLFVYIEAAIRLKVMYPKFFSFSDPSLCSGQCKSTSCTSTSKIFLFTSTFADPLQLIGEIIAQRFMEKNSPETFFAQIFFFPQTNIFTWKTKFLCWSFPVHWWYWWNNWEQSNTCYRLSGWIDCADDVIHTSDYYVMLFSPPGSTEYSL